MQEHAARGSVATTHMPGAKLYIVVVGAAAQLMFYPPSHKVFPGVFATTQLKLKE